VNPGCCSQDLVPAAWNLQIDASGVLRWTDGTYATIVLNVSGGPQRFRLVRSQ
jgi:hypothetical protein